MTGPVFRSCPFCRHSWQADPAAPLTCPKCGRANTAADEATPPPGSIPAVKAPSKKPVSQRPIAAPKSGHGVRNAFAILVGLAGALAAAWFLKLLPNWVWEPAEDAKKKAPQAAAAPKPEPEKPKEAAATPRPQPPKPAEPKPVEPAPKTAPPEPAPDFSKETAYTVSKVLSGDRIVVKGGPRDIEVKLIGVGVQKPGDAPVRGYVDGRESLEALKRLVQGKKVFLHYGQLDTATARALRDSYGTDRAWVFLSDGTFVNLEMIREGKARVDPDLAKEYLELLTYWEERAPR